MRVIKHVAFLLLVLGWLFVLFLFASCSVSTRLKTSTGVELKQCSTPTMVGAAPSLTPIEEKALRSAVDAWNGRGRPFMFVGRVPWEPDALDAPSAAMVIVGRPSGDFSSRSAAARAEISADLGNGCITKSRILVFVDPDEYGLSQFALILEHELGHVLGLRHVDEGVMQANLYRMISGERE